METKTTTSKQFSLNMRDITRGLITAVIGAVQPILLEAFNTWQSGGTFEINWDSVLRTGVGAGVAYIILNFSSKSKVITVVGSDTTVKDTEKQIRKVI